MLKTGDTSILQEYFRDIIYRDIVARHGPRNIHELRELVLYLASNLSCRMSYKKLQAVISVKSINTVKKYLGFLADAYLFITVNLFDYSVKKQIYNPAKIYCYVMKAGCQGRCRSTTGLFCLAGSVRKRTKQDLF